MRSTHAGCVAAVAQTNRMLRYVQIALRLGMLVLSLVYFFLYRRLLILI